MRQFILAIVLTVCSFSYSQNCDYIFLGKLSDFHDGSPIISATIFIKEYDKYVVSDLDGKFKIENLCNGTVTLEISHINCETKTVNYTVTSDIFKTIVLEHHTEALNEVSVTGYNTKKVTISAQETVLKSNTLKKYSALSLGDALQEIAGITTVSTGNTIVKPMINGLHSSRIIILNNSVRLQDQEWGIEHAPNVDINSADNISVIKGSGALAYGGDAIGGIIVINPKLSIKKDTLFGKTILGVQDNGKGYNFNTVLHKNYNNGWFFSAQGSVKRFGDFESPDYMLTNTGLASKGVTFRTGKRNFESGFELFYSYLDNEIGIMRASHIGNVEDLVSAINTAQPLVINDFSYDINSPKQEVFHHLIKGNYYKRFKNFGKITLQYDYQNNQRFEYDVRIGDNRNKPAVDLNLQTHTISADAILDANSNYTIKFGLLGRYQNNFANPDTEVRRLIPDYDKFDFGIYTVNTWNVSDNSILDFGFRYDFNRIDAKKFYRTSRWEERGYDTTFANFVIENLGTQLLTNPVFNFHNFSASAGLKHTLNSKSYILGNYSLSRRPPNPSELFSDGLHHSAARIELGDLNLKPELSNRFSVSYNYIGLKLNISAEGFYNRISDFMYIEPFGVEQTIRGSFPVWNYVQADSELYGLDLNLKYELSKTLTLFNQTSYTVGNNLETNKPLIDIPAFNTKNAISYTNANWKAFTAKLSSKWVFEQSQFPNNDFDAFIATTNTFTTVNISKPPQAFHILNFYTEATFKTSKKTNLNIALNVNNIMNTNYRTYLNRLRYFADDLGRTIQIQLQFNY